ncbi:hypothetical protein SAMN04487907_1011252 [Zunongwangia mangrovi]|uniref:CarboxypepD_reg-like domain-containing protein n=1 Tax=Zunongwangia mangrovi TaxID=1334022 RepID=A0A1I1F3B6_9FLAO|nr:carboxypeptidase-like regulatory domain-containing protein [Zunongwangia mangrovi]SFB93747.1 hypothetical protein SAMN04487907_1011252 [Zunongwangia mangrovi]
MLIVILFIYNSNGYAQQALVLDSLSLEPIPYANLNFGNNQGSVSNEDGIIFTPKDHEEYILSHLGYQTKKLPSKDLKDTLYLKALAYNLDEVVLNNFNARDTILKAFENIPKNFFSKPYNQEGIFRYSLKKDGKGVEMIETDFLSYKASLEEETKTKISEVKKTEKYKRMNLLSGVAEFLNIMDPTLKNAPILEKLKTMNFSYAGRIENEEEEIYKIEISGGEDSANGHIFLSKNQLTIKEIKVEYLRNQIPELTPDKPNHNTRIASLIKISADEDGKQFLSYAEITNDKTVLFKNDSIFRFEMKGKIAFNKLIQGKKVKKFRSNYNSKKAFNKTVAKFKQKQQWTNSQMLPMTTEDLNILKDIYAN